LKASWSEALPLGVGASAAVRLGRASASVAAETIFDPSRRQLARYRKSENVLIEAAHRGHVAHEYDRVVDRADRLESGGRVRL
jgi:hypothetical protein